MCVCVCVCNGVGRGSAGYRECVGLRNSVLVIGSVCEMEGRGAIDADRVRVWGRRTLVVVSVREVGRLYWL